jgi:ubiquinone/menaquinone biosynthesis C-methylase UbiE
MLGRALAVALATLATAAGVTVARRVRGHVTGRHVRGGILISDPAGYDTHSRILFGWLLKEIAADIAASASSTAKVLEVGCGPGHLSVRLARDHNLDVTGLDLDPAMIERARGNAARSSRPAGRVPAFVVADVAALPFDVASFDLVVSTFSMHHWSDPRAGFNEIARVLRRGGRALIWDLKPGLRLFHAHVADPASLVYASSLRLVSARPWRWPWRFTLSHRLELAPV